jgi:protocatechuate 3,4-dioxygenase beta subunit
MTTKKTFVRWAMMGAMTLALLVSFADSGRGQEARASIGGRVVDAQGAIVAGAQVVVVSEDTGVKQTTTTNSDGNWSVHFLIPGRYTSRWVRLVQQVVSTDRAAADIRAIDVELAVGSASDHITVSDDAPLIDTTAATSGTVINQKQVLEMPTNSRVVTLFATLSPGVLGQDQNNNVFQLWSFNAASQFTVNGGTNNSRSVAFELDGMHNMM